jgi:hypothetical protein
VSIDDGDKPRVKGKIGMAGLYALPPGPMPLLINAFKIAPYRRHYYTEGYGGPYGSVQQMIVQLPGAGIPVNCMAFANSGDEAVVLQGGREGPALRKVSVRKLVDRESLASEKALLWSRPLDADPRSPARGQKPYHYASMLVSGETVVVAGRFKGSGAGSEPAPTARDVAPGVLRTFDLRTGEPRQTLELDAAPVVSGLAAAYGRVYVACEDGSLRCLGE